MQPDVDTVCIALKEMQVLRKFVIKTQIRITNSATALAARMCGYEATDDEASREKQWRRADGIVSRALVGKPPLDDDKAVVLAIGEELEMVKFALKPIEHRLDIIKREMARQAACLSLGNFVDATHGFNLLGLAVIVGEAGNLSNYSTVRKLWRRLGYGMAQGHEDKAYSTWRFSGGLSKDDWIKAGYSPQRLAEIYGVVTVPLMMHKKKNKYGAVYDARRARTLVTHPEWWVDKNGKTKLTKDGVPCSKHGDEDAKRVATKVFMADLWSEWRQCRSTTVVDATGGLVDVAA
jgi:hypothetical protein